MASYSTEELYGYPERDWKLFRKKAPVWQEAYMEKLVKEYIDILNSDANASDKFWNLRDRIEEDEHLTGVIMEMSRSKMIGNIISLAREGAITWDDLKDFSDELKERLSFLSDFPSDS